MTAPDVLLEFPLYPKQMLALNSPASELLYGGAAGPGKSHLLRVEFITLAMDIPGLQLYLFRRKYRDLIQGHMEGPTGFKAMLEPFIKGGAVEVVELEIRFKNGVGGGFIGGSRISLNHCNHEDDVFNYKTIEFHVLGLEETTEFTKFQIQYLGSRVRLPSAIKLPDRYLMPKEFWRRPDTPRYSIPRRIYPTNPGGPGHDFIKRGFIDGREPMTLWNASLDEGGALRQFIPGLITDNPAVNPEEYAMTLSGLPPAYRDALLYGLWTARVGSFYPEWDTDRHVVKELTGHDLPDHWFKYRTFDWGTSEPAYCGFFAISTSEPFKDLQGRERWFPKGALILYDELNMCDPKEPEKGLRLTNKEMAERIVAHSMLSAKKVPTLSDSKPFQGIGGKQLIDGTQEGPAKDFQNNGVPLDRADTSRVAGWSALRDRLIGIDYDTGSEVNRIVKLPMLYVAEHCKYAREYIPTLPYHPDSEGKPEDAADSGESTHCLDCLRYSAMAHNTAVIKKFKPSIEVQTNKILQQMSKNRNSMGAILKAQGLKL